VTVAADNKLPVANVIAILVTRRCNMSCAHCSVESGPRVETADPSAEELYRIIREARQAGVRAVQFTGGEPMMRQKLVLELMRECHRLGMTSGLTTNGFWGKNAKTARTTLREMIRHGLTYMTVSYDRYHADFMGPEPILTLAEIARDIGFTFNVNVTRTLLEENLEEYARLFGSLPNVRMRLYDVQPVGRARNFEMPNLRAETEGFCNAAAQATFTEDGRMICCNGPAYFDEPGSPRLIGDLKNESIATLLQRHWSDPVLETIRTFGPAGLRDELKQDERFATAFDRRFAGQCDLCHYITGNSEMISVLRERLADSHHQALRAAKWAMITGARSSGELSRDYANGPGLAGVFYHRITRGSWPEQPERLFGRADIDWDHQAEYLAGCGLANRLAPAAAEEEIARWAPSYFGESLQKRAMRDALRELSHRETLEKIHKALLELGVRGILLKGAAIYLREQDAEIAGSRIPGDIDLWIENAAAADALRRKLIGEGFDGDADAPRTGPHHLAPVRWRTSDVEIHTGIMPAFWGLPESQMAADMQPLRCWPSFSTLSAEDMIVHEAIHCTTHLYSFGLKLAVDIFRIVQLAEMAGNTIDWQKIADRTGRTRCPRAFWVPVAALHQGLGDQSPFPPEFMNRAPKDERQRRMNLVAYKRLFSAVDKADEMNPFTRNGIFLMLHDGPINRLRYLAELSRGDAAESRRTAMQGRGGQSYKNLKRHLRSAWMDLKQYRRAVR